MVAFIAVFDTKQRDDVQVSVSCSTADANGIGSERTESPPPIAPMTPKKQRCALTYEQIAAHDPELDGDHESM